MQKLEISPYEPIVNVKTYTRAVLKNKWWIGLFVIVVTIFSAHYIAGLAPQYQATTSLLIKPEKDKAISIDEVYILDASKKEYLLTQFEVLRSKAIAEAEIDQNKKEKKQKIQIGEGGIIRRMKANKKT